MPITPAQAKRLLPYLIELPHKNPSLYGLTNAAFRSVNLEPCIFIESPLDCGTGYAEVGGIQRWCQIVDKAEFEKFAQKEKVMVGR